MNASVRPLFTPGAFPGMPSDLYFAIEALSQSGCKKILQSPAHYLFDRNNPSAPTASMQFGTTVHDGVLEPDEYEARVAGLPSDAPKCPTSAQLNAKKPSPETAAAIEYWQRVDADNAGKIVLSADEYRRSRACVDAVRAHPAAAYLLAGAEVETSIFWQDAKYKVPCKSRIDARNHGGIVDLKTTQDASPEGFAKSIANFKYHLQAAFYFSGCEHVFNETPRFFAFIAVESEPPHAVACYSLPGNAVLAGAHLAARALERYAEAFASGVWKGYPDTVESITLPAWATRFEGH